MSENLPLISVIIPTKNRKELLLNAVNSVLHQTYKRIQIIIHDNNSNDGTEFLFREILQDKRIEYYRSEHDLSMTENWNTAFSRVNGEYFVRLDDDNVFTNDFLERALFEIKQSHLDVVNFSELIVHLDGRTFTIFKEQNVTEILNKYQLAYLGYFSLIDSNYTLYRTKLIKMLFQGGNVYQTTLPDRNMDYVICDNMDAMNIVVAINFSIKGLTRFDYRSHMSKDYALKYVDYTSIATEEILKSMDCKNNFSMHRITTVAYFLRNAQDEELREFLSEKITHKELYTTLMRLGHVYMTRSCYNWSELGIYIKYYWLVFLDLFVWYKYALEGRHVVINFIVAVKNFSIGVTKSIFNILINKKRSSDKLATKLGDSLSLMIINGNEGEFFGKSVPIYKDPESLLRKINKLARK